MKPRQAFAEFEVIERRFGTDDSPLFKVLHALIEQGESLEATVRAHDAKLALLAGEEGGATNPVAATQAPDRGRPANPPSDDKIDDTLPGFPVAPKRGR